MNETQMNNILSRASQLMNDERFNSIVESTRIVSDGEGNILESERGSYRKPSRRNSLPMSRGLCTR